MVNTSGAQASIGNGQTMNTDAALYWNAMVQRIFQEHGIFIVATEGTRTYARQAELYNGYIQGRIDPRTGQKYNPAYPPNSPYAYHLSGRAVDVGSSVGYVNTNNAKVFRMYAGSYGFRPTVSNEPWHFEWRQEWTSADPTPTPAQQEPIPIEYGSEEMYVIYNLDRPGNHFLVGKEYLHDLGSDVDAILVSAITSTKDEIHDITDAQVATIFAALGVPDMFRTNPKALYADGRNGLWSKDQENANALARLEAALKK